MPHQKVHTSAAALYHQAGTAVQSYGSLPETGFCKLPQIIGDKKRNILPVIPVSRSTFLAMVKKGEWPQPVRLGVRSVAWKVSEIRALIEKLGG